MVTPVFLLSLPRAGSTLVQRALATSPSIATSAEPWLLLPVLYAVSHRQVDADYNDTLCKQAISDFCQLLPGGTDDYLQAARLFAERLYATASWGTTPFFLDKTPRYSLIASQLMDAFPNAKFIFLWRNPLAVTASMVETWANSKWNIDQFAVDLFDGLASLVAAYQNNLDRTIAVRYEDLVTNPSVILSSLFEYIGLSGDHIGASDFDRVKFVGRMGDQVGVKKYRHVSSASVDHWMTVLANPIRRTWSHRYLNWIGDERLKLMGYDAAELQEQIRHLPLVLDGVAGDMCCMLRTYARKTARRHRIAPLRLASSHRQQRI